MLKKLLNGNIQIIDKVKNWEESVIIASQPLIEKKDIEPRYVDAMISNIKEIGPYVVLMPGVAMPHSRPENGVNKTVFSFLLIREGVSYSKDKELVKLVIVLAAKDSNEHIEALTELSDLLDNEEKVNKIFEAINIEEIEKNI